MQPGTGSLAPNETDQADKASRWQGITDLRRHTARGMIITGVYNVGLVGLSALRGLVVAVFLTKADYGLWAILGLMMWTALGLKYVFGANEKYVQQSDSNQEHAFQRAFTVEAIYSIATTPVATGVVFVFAAVTGHSAVVAPGLVMLLLLPAMTLQFALSPLYRQMQYRRQRTLEAAEPVVAFVVTIVLAVLGCGYWSLVIGTVSGSWAGALVAWRACPYRLAWRYDRGTLRSYVSFSAPLLISGFTVLGMFEVIVLAGNSVLGLGALGAFTLVGNLVQFTDQADAIITDTLYPAVCAVKDKLTLQKEIFVKSNRLSLMWAVPFGVGMSLFGADLVRFGVGSRWTSAIPLLQVMGIVTAVHHVGYNWGAFIKARGNTWPIAIVAAIGFVAIVGPVIPLMHVAGLVGIGYAFAIGEVAGLVARGVVLARLFRGFRIVSQLFRGFAPSILAAIPVLALHGLRGHEHTLPEALAVLALYLVITISATVAFERSLLQEALSYLFRRRAGTLPVGVGAAR
jgi:O-antigen/teichoic acid export membrane protein